MNNVDHRFSMLSPLDHRYYFANKTVFDSLALYFSEEAVITYNIKIEIALLKSIAPYCGIDETLITEAVEQSKNISVSEVLEEEEKTKHNLRAIVNVLKRHMPEKVAPYIHLGATSFDISDTAASLRLKEASNTVILPLLITLQEQLISFAEQHLSVPQVGRTHGQFAVPITIGHAFAEYISRLGNSILEIRRHISMLTGKLSGAVGAYNALSLMVPDPIDLEKKHLASLGLLPSEYSNQVCAPEPVLRLLLEYNVAFGIIANLADDLRNLQRSEIGEVFEYFDESTQVGSSTMPQKRNPWNSEHIKSLYKVFSPRVLTFYMDQITEHQRDLTNSASGRFIAEYVAGFSAAINRAVSVVKTLKLDTNNIEKNIALAGDSILSEAAYILLALSGYSNAHEILRNANIMMSKEQCNIVEALRNKKEVWASLEAQLKKQNLPPATEFFSDIRNYTGKSVEKSAMIIATHKNHIAHYKTKV